MKRLIVHVVILPFQCLTDGITAGDVEMWSALLALVGELKLLSFLPNHKSSLLERSMASIDVVTNAWHCYD